MKARHYLYLILFSFGLGICTQAEPTQDVYRDSVDQVRSFGMQLRSLPKESSAVYAPAVVQEAPGNESTLVRLSDATLKIFFVNRPGKADKLMSVSSKDHGVSWSEPAVAFDLPGQAYYANQVLLGQDGELHCVFHIFGEGENGYRGRHLNLWYCHTTNQQKVWSAPRKIFDGYVGAIRGFIQLKNGRLLLAFAKAVPARMEAPPPGTPDFGWNDVVVMYSDDAGKTWEFSENNIKIATNTPNTTRYGAIEPTLLELKDGSLWMLIRTRLGYLYESYSCDSGASWKAPQPTSFISSDSPATLLRLSDGRIAMFWCSNQRWDDPRSYAIGGREVLHAAISADEGKTWEGFREVLNVPPLEVTKGDRGTAYPSVTETKDGKIVLVSGQGEGQRAIVLLDPAWLEETTLTDDFSSGLVQWTLFGSDSATCIQKTNTQQGKKALHIRKSAKDRNQDTQAVWNFPMAAQGEIVMEIQKHEESKGINITLTDHFSIAGDTAASQHAVVNFTLDPFTEDPKITLTLRWNMQEEKALLYGNVELLAEQSFQRKPSFGLNYVRLGIPGEEEDLSGYDLQSIRFTAQEKL